MTAIGGEDGAFVDLSHPDDVFDIYYRACAVSWQPEKLTVTALPRSPESSGGRELSVELNAFIDLGRDENGFVQVNQMNFFLKPELKPAGRAGALLALPDSDQTCVFDFRLPRDVELVVRYWIVDGTKGVPFRVDAWRIGLDDDGAPSATFYPFEPESYL
ncbi:MAG: hypothetical protein M5R36_00235 [Deltaproteobacteria bacterium]|nr:hypothetical protein [Deltaproteobacteria bacterium]